MKNTTEILNFHCVKQPGNHLINRKWNVTIFTDISWPFEQLMSLNVYVYFSAPLIIFFKVHPFKLIEPYKIIYKMYAYVVLLSNKYRITAALKDETDIIASIAVSPIGWAGILVIMYAETYKTDVDCKMTSHRPIFSSLRVIP